MEISRLQVYKNKRKKKLILFSKIVIVFYLIILSFSYLTNGTVAYFNTNGNLGITFEAGSWFDGSELIFTGKGNQHIKSCTDVEITVKIKNQGFNMTGPTKYEIYYVENGEPRINGTSVYSEGVIGPLGAGEETSLSYIATNSGFYEFKAFQRKGYEGENDIIWSEKIIVSCNEKQTTNDMEGELNSTDIEKDVNESPTEQSKTNEVIENSVVVEEETSDGLIEDSQVQDSSSTDTNKEYHTNSPENNDKTDEGEVMNEETD